MDFQSQFLIFLLTVLQLTYAQNFTAAPPTCPTNSAVFTCAFSDLLNNQSTTWRIGSYTCELDHATPNASATCGPSDAFTAQLLSPPVGDVYTSTLTVTAAVTLDKRNVECMFGELVGEQRLDVIALPQLPDAVSQNHSQDTVNRTTVINWQPATVDSASNNVTYIVTNGSDLIMDFDNTTATATVALPAFNTDYSFCVDAVNVCGLYSGKPKCATPPVRIGAEVAGIDAFNADLICSLPALTIRTSWTVNTSRNGNVFRPPLTSLDLNLMCNSVSRNLTTSTTEFNFSDAGCVSATEASTITLTAENVFGRKVVVTVLPPSYRTPVVSGQQLIIENWAVCIGLNPTCAESLSLFTLEMSFKSDGVDMVVTGQARGCGSNGFKFSIQEYEDTISLATVVIKFNTMEIERITNLSLVERAPSDNTLAIGLGVGLGGGLILLGMVLIVIGLLVVCYKLGRCCFSSSGVPGEDDDMQLKEGTLSHEQERPTYQDPGEIKRQPAPDSHDVYTVPEKKPKKKKAQAARVEEISATEAGPMYQDPDTINRHPATESGQLYSGGANEEGLLAEEASRGTKTEEELAEMFSTPDKSRQREGVNYTDLSLPGSSAPPPSQAGVQYAQVRLYMKPHRQTEHV